MREEKNLKKTGCCHTRHYHEAHGSTKVICLNTGCDNYLGYTRARFSGSFYKKMLTGLFMILSAAVLMYDYSPEGLNMEAEEASLFFEITDASEILNIENLESEILANEIICPEIVLAQMCLESGNLKSFLLDKTNNMLGMRFPFQRSTTAIGIYLPAKDTIIYGSQDELRKYGKLNNYAVYETWQDAVSDYKLWQDYCFNTQKTYMEFLGRVYAEDPNYVNKLKKMTKADA